MSESRVAVVLKSLNSLEDDLDSLNSKAADIKQALSIKVQTEIDAMLEKTQKIATSEVEMIISASRERATAESQKITKEGQTKLAEIQEKIAANFDDAVSHVVSTILKP